MCGKTEKEMTQLINEISILIQKDSSIESEIDITPFVPINPVNKENNSRNAHK